MLGLVFELNLTPKIAILLVRFFSKFHLLLTCINHFLLQDTLEHPEQIISLQQGGWMM